MEGDSERTKISYFHHWINGEGMGHIKSWKNSKTLILQSACDELDEDQQAEERAIRDAIFLGMNSQ